MNTTKGEDYGWFEMALNQFPVAGKRVLLWAKNHGMITGSWNGKEWESSYGVEFGDKTVTHWRELPKPPKLKDAFETWWGGHAKTDYDALVITNGDEHFCAKKEIARYIWEAAIHSTKQ